MGKRERVCEKFRVSCHQLDTAIVQICNKRHVIIITEDEVYFRADRRETVKQTNTVTGALYFWQPGEVGQARLVLVYLRISRRFYVRPPLHPIVRVLDNILGHILLRLEPPSRGYPFD